MAHRVSHMPPTNTALVQNGPSRAESGIAQLLERLRQFKTVERADKSFSLATEALKEDSIWENGPIGACIGDLRPYQRAISQVIEPTLMDYCPEMESVLEIGSGSHPILEYLPHLPQECKNRIHLSDFKEEYLHQIRAKYPQNNASLVDVKSLSDNLAQKSHRCIVMHDVFNAFFKKEIEKACGEIHKTLKPEGYLIHFSTREANFIDTLDEFKNENLIYFPLLGLDGIWKGITVLDRCEYMRYVQSLGPGDRAVKEFFLEYASLDPFDLDQFCGDACLTNFSPVFAGISEGVEEWHCQSAKKILFEDHFQKKVEQALTDSGFCIKKNEDVSGRYIGPRVENQHQLNLDKHLFYVNRSNHAMHYSGVLALGMIQEQAAVHVIVAQKM